MTTTFPNQRIVHVHREHATANFLGIKNENWQAAARDLGAHSLMLYLYFAANKDDYKLALSPAAIRKAIGMPPQTYRDQFVKLVDKGYLVPTRGNTYDFFEVPHAARVTPENNTIKNSYKTAAVAVSSRTPDVLESPPNTQTVRNETADNREINNTVNNPPINNIDNYAEKPVSPRSIKPMYIF